MSDTSLNNKRIAKNTLFLYFRMILLMCISLYTSRVVLDKLGVDDFGIYNVVGGVITTFTFISSAMTVATQRFLNYSMGKGDAVETRKVFNASQIIHLVFALLVILAVETIGLWFLYNKLVIPPERFEAAFGVFQFSTLTTAFLILSFPYNATIIAREKMQVFAYVSIIDGIGKLFVALAISYSPIDKLVFYGILLMALQITVSLIYRIYCLRHYEETHFKINNIERSLYKKLLTFSGWNILGNIANVSLIQGTNILLNMFFGPSVNAAKGVATQVQNAVNQFCNNFQLAQNPQIVKSYAAGDMSYVHNLIFRASRFSFYLTLVFAVPIIMNVDFVLGLWLKNIPDYACVFVQYTMGFSLIQALAGPLLTGSLATGNAKTIMSVIAIFFWSVLPLCYFALKMGSSPIAVFQIMLTLYLVAHVMRVAIVSRQLKFTVADYIRQVLLPVVTVAILISCAAILYDFSFHSDDVVAKILSTVVSVAWTIAIVWFVGITKGERIKLVLIIKKKIQKV